MIGGVRARDVRQNKIRFVSAQIESEWTTCTEHSTELINYSHHPHCYSFSGVSLVCSVMHKHKMPKLSSCESECADWGFSRKACDTEQNTLVPILLCVAMVVLCCARELLVLVTTAGLARFQPIGPNILYSGWLWSVILLAFRRRWDANARRIKTHIHTDIRENFYSLRALKQARVSNSCIYSTYIYVVLCIWPCGCFGCCCFWIA